MNHGFIRAVFCIMTFILGFSVPKAVVLDPGLNDVSHSFLKLLERNFHKFPLFSTQQVNVREFFRTYDPTPSTGGSFWRVQGSKTTTFQMQVGAQYELDDFPRKFVLLCEEYQSNYNFYHTTELLTNTKMLQDTFRQYHMPIFWTTWVRSMTDGKYGALDRFAGTRISVPKEVNFSAWFTDAKHVETYLYGPSSEILKEVAPVTPAERLNILRSEHYSKFADRDSYCHEILYPSLQKLGINTLVLTGSFTEACIIATAIEAVDRYGLDVILVHDAIASPSSTDVQLGALNVMTHSFVKLMNTSNIIKWFHSHAQSLDATHTFRV